MFERSSCIEGSANQGDNLNQIGSALQDFEWENGFDRAESSSLQTVSPIYQNFTRSNRIFIIQGVNAAFDLFNDFAQMRKGSVERRLQRWGYQARRVLVLLTDQNLYPDTEVLADQAAQNGIEVIPVQFDNEFK